VQIAAPAGCEPAARAYFSGLLGLIELPKPGDAGAGGAWFRVDERELHVGVDPAFRAAGKAHVGLAVADVAALEALAERLAGAGYPVRWNTGLPGVRRFFTEDPWGNRLELLARIG
jgi:catechol 2,3-dioxygenase-like lactoylglutathione lyase family enzyme